MPDRVFVLAIVNEDGVRLWVTETGLARDLCEATRYSSMDEARAAQRATDIVVPVRRLQPPFHPWEALS